MADVRLEHVSKTYPGGVCAVDGLTLQVQEGELMVLAGPSGGGKTTVLRLVAGLERLTSGSIWIGDRRADRLQPRERDVAMVFQDYALYPHLTAARNIAFALRQRGMARAEVEQRVQETAALLDIVPLLDRKPAELSGGQQQRVALGRAIARRPQCMLLDEPLSNLDAPMRSQLRHDIKRLQRQVRTTTIYVTHDQEEALTLGDRLAVLHEGRLQQVDAPLEVYRRPANSFVARFIGAPPMNLVTGRARCEGERRLFDDGRGVRLAIPGPASLDGSTRESVLGIRPEAMRVTAAGDDRECITITVELCEPVGDRMDVIGATSGGTTLRARLATDDGIRPGCTMRLTAAPEAVHLFEPGPGGRG